MIMKKQECKNYFDSYIRYLLNHKMDLRKLKKIKNHIHSCRDCQNNFMMFVDIIEQYLLESTHKASGLKDINNLLTNYFSLYIDRTTRNMIKYLVLNRKYRTRVISKLNFKTNMDLYDFYESKLIPAFDEHLYNFN